MPKKVYDAVPLRTVAAREVKAAFADAGKVVARFCVCCGEGRLNSCSNLVDGTAWRCRIWACSCSAKDYAFLQFDDLDYRLFHTSDNVTRAGRFDEFMDKYSVDGLAPRWRGLEEAAYVLEDGSLILPGTLKHDGYAMGIVFEAPKLWKRIFEEHRDEIIKLECAPEKRPVESRQPTIAEEPAKTPARKREKGFKLDLETLIVAYLVMTH